MRGAPIGNQTYASQGLRDPVAWTLVIPICLAQSIRKAVVRRVRSQLPYGKGRTARLYGPT